MTDTEKIADLEARVKRFEDFFTFITNPYTGEIGVMTAGRLGVMTAFWMQQPTGWGAALSVGTFSDQYAIYAELEARTPVSGDRTALLARCDAINPNHVNRAVEAIANNSSIANVAIRAEARGIELAQAVVAFYIGKSISAMKQLWP